MMSRPVAGVRNHTLIITLPGSPKGAKENLEAILKLLPHACLQAAGADSRLLHAGGVKRLEQDSGVGRGSFIDLRHHHSHDHSHSHSHGTGHGHPTPRAHTSGGGGTISNDPKAGPTRRHRESPYPMLSVDEATELIFQHTQRPKAMTRLVGSSLVGSVLAHDVKAAENVPAFRASTVDGYAIVINQETGGSKGFFPVVSVSHASPVRLEPLAHGQLARITTGACLPPGATSVVMVEDTVLHGMTDDGQEEEEVEILTDEIESGENVREVGSDIRAGEIIVNEGTEITAVGGELGLLASVGQATVLVYRKPIVGVLSTGDEIVQHDRAEGLRLGEVRDCNRPTIIAAVRSWGYEVVDLGIAKDTYVFDRTVLPYTSN
jgi:gephyrin